MTPDLYQIANINGYPITIKQTSYNAGEETFAVWYGQQQFEDLGIMEASKIIGECIAHSMACEGIVELSCD